jgi:hypothetical protein
LEQIALDPAAKFLFTPELRGLLDTTHANPDE